MGKCLRTKKYEVSEDDDTKKLYNGNVFIIGTKESWDAKITEANEQNKLELSSSWDIRVTPTFFFLRNGKQIDKLVGANKPELEKKIAFLANSVLG